MLFRLKTTDVGILIKTQHPFCLFLSGYREADGLTALSIAAGKKHKTLTEILASEYMRYFRIKSNGMK